MLIFVMLIFSVQVFNKLDSLCTLQYGFVNSRYKEVDYIYSPYIQPWDDQEHTLRNGTVLCNRPEYVQIIGNDDIEQCH